MLVVAAYFMFAPLSVLATNGSRWNCGNALNSPTDPFGIGLCGKINATYMARGIAALAAGVVTAVGGFLLFGSVSKVEFRRPATTDPEAL